MNARIVEGRPHNDVIRVPCGSYKCTTVRNRGVKQCSQHVSKHNPGHSHTRVMQTDFVISARTSAGRCRQTTVVSTSQTRANLMPPNQVGDLLGSLIRAAISKNRPFVFVAERRLSGYRGTMQVQLTPHFEAASTGNTGKAALVGWRSKLGEVRIGQICVGDSFILYLEAQKLSPLKSLNICHFAQVIGNHVPKQDLHDLVLTQGTFLDVFWDGEQVRLYAFVDCAMAFEPSLQTPRCLVYLQHARVAIRAITLSHTRLRYRRL